MGVVSLIGFIAILLFLNSWSNGERKKRERREAEENLRWYNTIKNCLWCGGKYQVKNGNRHYCSRKCQHEDSNK